MLKSYFANKISHNLDSCGSRSFTARSLSESCLCVDLANKMVNDKLLYLLLTVVSRAVFTLGFSVTLLEVV